MSDDRDFLQMPRMFGRKFILFSIIVIVAATTALIFFDKTDPDKFNPMHIPHRDTTGPVPYKAIEADTNQPK